MTVALCPDCGSLKSGVLLPCDDCGFQLPSNQEDGMSLSTHYLSENTLEDFSNLFKELRKEASTNDIAAWAFFYMLSQYYPEIVDLDIPKEYQKSSKALLNRLEVDNIIIEDSPNAYSMDSIEAKYATKIKHYTTFCPNCRSKKSIAAWHVINGSMDEVYKPFILTLKPFQSRCLACGDKHQIKYDSVYFEFDERKIAIRLRNPETDPRYTLRDVPKSYFEELSNEFQYRMVHNKLDFVEKIMIFNDGLSDIRVEHAKLIFSIQNRYDIRGDLYYDRLETSRFKGNRFVFRDPNDDFKEVSLSLNGRKEQEKQIVSKLKEELKESDSDWLYIDQPAIWRALKRLDSITHLF